MNIAVIGAGGLARIVYEILSYDRNMEVVAFVDYLPRTGKETIKDIPILGDHSVVAELMKKGVRGAIVAVSMNNIRKSHFEKFEEMGLEMINAIHPTVSLSPSVKVGNGVTIAIGAIISTDVHIGDNAIINTGAIVDHECRIGDHVHIATGCSLAGRVTVHSGALVGIGTAVKENVTIGENAIISAGSVVLEDIPAGATAGGVPARVVDRR